MADWVQHIPRARQHVVTYAGWFANALGKLNPKKDNETNTVEELAEKPTGKWVKWRTLILRCWAVDPELCPRCHKEMKRARALLQQHELQRLLKNLGIGLYPTRPRSPPPLALDQEGQLRAFYNVCRHHAALVTTGEGCAQQLTCPYHGWTYDLDGRLRKAPRLGAVKEFQREQYGLRPIAMEVWGPWVWLNFSPSPTPLAEQMGPLAQRVHPDSLGSLRFVASRSYELECNWKVYVDNYLDGGYHVEVAHQALAAQLDLDDYQTRVVSPLVLQTCGAGAGAEGPDFAERLAGGAVYAWLYPNWMFNRYGPILDTNWVIPLSAERCLTVFEYFFAPECSEEFIERSLQASHRVQLEDVEICQSVQRGLRSRGYDVGRYAPSLEMGEYAFHQWLARDLMASPVT